MGKPEAYVEDYLVDRAEACGCLCYKFASPSNAGVPDRIIIREGRTWYVECKAPGEGPRPLQRAVFRKMRRHGVHVHVVDTREAVDKLLAAVLSADSLPLPPTGGGGMGDEGPVRRFPVRSIKSR